MYNFNSVRYRLTNLMALSNPVLLSIIELGGYPDFSRLYRETGYEVISMDCNLCHIINAQGTPDNMEIAGLG